MVFGSASSSVYLSCSVERGYCTDGFFRHRTQYRSYVRRCQVFILISSTIITKQSYIFYRVVVICKIMLKCFLPSTLHFMTASVCAVSRLTCIPGSARKHSEGGAWITQPTWSRKAKGTIACCGTQR